MSEKTITTDDVEHLPHIVILRTNGAVEHVVEFDCGRKAHSFAIDAAARDACGEIIVCVRVRTLESMAHKLRHQTN